jgi:phosphate transport system protein
MIAPHDPTAMSQMVVGMVQYAIQTFQRQDARQARTVMSLDGRVDALDAQIFREMLDRAVADAAGRARSMSLILVARSLERVADHATNIGEEVCYVVEGTDIRHQT